MNSILKLFSIVFLLIIANHGYAQNITDSEKKICEDFKSKIEEKRLELKIKYKSGNSIDAVKADNGLESLMDMLIPLFAPIKARDTNKHLTLLENSKNDKNLIAFLKFINEQYDSNKKAIKDQIPGQHAVPNSPPPSADEFTTTTVTPQQGDKRILGIFDLLDIILICAFLILALFIGLAFSEISKLKKKILQEKQYNQNQHLPILGMEGYNRLERSVESNSNTVNKLQKEIDELKTQLSKLVPNIDSISDKKDYTTANNQPTNSSPKLQSLYVSCRGTKEKLLKATFDKDNDSIFEINQNNCSVKIIENASDASYSYILDNFSSFSHIMKASDSSKSKSPTTQNKKIVTVNPGNVQRVSENEWQIVDKQLIEVKFE